MLSFDFHWVIDQADQTSIENLFWQKKCHSWNCLLPRLNKGYILRYYVTIHVIHPGFSGVKKSLVLEPGSRKISIRTSIYFHPISDGQVTKYSARLFFLDCQALFCNRTSKNLYVIVHRTSEHFKIFLALLFIKMLEGVVCGHVWNSQKSGNGR